MYESVWTFGSHQLCICMTCMHSTICMYMDVCISVCTYAYIYMRVVPVCMHVVCMRGLCMEGRVIVQLVSVIPAWLDVCMHKQFMHEYTRIHTLHEYTRIHTLCVCTNTCALRAQLCAYILMLVCVSVCLSSL
jgi:hypothetical protein